MKYQEISSEWLHEQYIKNQKSTSTISNEIGVRQGQIRRLLKRYNIPLRPRISKISKEWLEEQYTICGKSSSEIAKEIKVSPNNICHLLRQYNIPRNALSKISKKRLEEQYISYNKSPSLISKEMGISKTHVCRLLKQYNIPLHITKSQSISKEKLEDAYHNEKLSQQQLAKKFNCSTALITRLFKKFNIQARNQRDAHLLISSQISEQVKKHWQNPEYRKNLLGRFNTTTEKMAYMAANQLGKQTSIETILYSILNDLGIKYEKQKIIGYWSFDCFLPEYNILIECQGNYWHSLPKAIANDKSKSTYIKEYFPQYSLIYIWEHEFKCKDKIIDLIKYKTKKDFTVEDFDFEDIEIKEVERQEAEEFVSKYHYAGRINKSSTKYGAYIGNILIGICVFGSVTRLNNAQKDSSKIRELLRFCIHPKYQKYNFASWLLSRSLKLIQNKLNLTHVITFADETFNHMGTIYKATNWKYTNKIKASYWYVNSGDYVMHKKTLWDHASKMKMSEKKYAVEYGYLKVTGKEKHKYVYEF